MNKKIHQINAVLQYFFHKFWHSDFFDHEQHIQKKCFTFADFLKVIKYLQDIQSILN